MTRGILVHIELDGITLPVGRLWYRSDRGREGSAFEYEASWLRHPRRFALEPALALVPGTRYTEDGQGLFGAVGDSAPDRWGRLLMRKAIRHGNGADATVTEIDYLLGVDDVARAGALRFSSEPEGPFLALPKEGGIPPEITLPRLLAAAERVEGEEETAEDLRLLLAPGSSMGGARPKASITDRSGNLALAKFPGRNDDWDVTGWEGLTLGLARLAGIEVPDHRLVRIGSSHVLIARRFDRAGERRIPYLSAMSMVGARDHQGSSYLEVADAIRRYGAEPDADLCRLWRRIVFNILVSNVDDHLRNLGFLFRIPNGWVLAPAFDLNPVPVDVRPRILSTCIDLVDAAASIDTALGVSGYFGLIPARAREVAGEVARAVTSWRSEAASMGFHGASIDRMAGAFEHEDMRKALAIGT